MPSEWFCRIDDAEFGPFTSTALRELVAHGRLTGDDHVRKGTDGQWISAGRVKGLFDAAKPVAPVRPASSRSRRSVDERLSAAGEQIADDDIPEAEVVDDDDEAILLESASGPVSGRPPSVVRARASAAAMSNIQSIDQCISVEEKKLRLGVNLINGAIWIGLCFLFVFTAAIALVVYALGRLLAWLLSEYNVRKLQAFGTTATPEQFPEIDEALRQICDQFSVRKVPKVIVLNHKSFNAFALKFAQRKVIVLLTETLEGILHRPAELRFIMGHELAHILLDHGWRGIFEIYKGARYKAARELTCDNCGCACAGDVDAAKTTLKRLGAGNVLHTRLNEEFLEQEANYLYSGFTGWILRQYLTYPPLGKRIANVGAFAARDAG